MRDLSTVPAGRRAAGLVDSIRWSRLPGSRGLLRIAVLLAILTGWSGLASAVEVRDVRWGFNGAYKRHAYNLCTIELLNPSTEAFQGDVTLTKEGGVGSSDIPLIEPGFYIPAGETRTVQFFPYIASDKPDFRVSWGPRGSDGPCRVGPISERFSMYANAPRAIR